MAFIKCSGGGKLKETILWENPDPSVNFSDQTIIFDYGGVIHDINDYEYISLKWCKNKTTITDLMEIFFTPENLKKSLEPNTSNTNSCAFAGRNASGLAYVRQIMYKTDTSARLTIGYSLGGTSASTSTQNTIPIIIKGWK